MTAPLDWIDKYEDSAQINRVQIYEDKGEGFAEEGSYFVKDAYEGENRIALELRVAGDVKQLRVDPAFAPCAVKIQEVAWNGSRWRCTGGRFSVPTGASLFRGRKGTGTAPASFFPRRIRALLSLWGSFRAGRRMCCAFGWRLYGCPWPWRRIWGSGCPQAMEAGFGVAVPQAMVQDLG